ncbi:baculoviral IAP repeat-containing protein 7 isoform X4 [Camelus bactrianus]|uniref:Baculoviral IAP repeat-containing protein 7 isoform X4 n=1 Tax=Camelus bactrianus TaxID=9837 RepID=A0AC58P0Z1_CAMBA
MALRGPRLRGSPTGPRARSRSVGSGAAESRRLQPLAGSGSGPDDTPALVPGTGRSEASKCSHSESHLQQAAVHCTLLLAPNAPPASLGGAPRRRALLSSGRLLGFCSSCPGRALGSGLPEALAGVPPSQGPGLGPVLVLLKASRTRFAASSATEVCRAGNEEMTPGRSTPGGSPGVNSCSGQKEGTLSAASRSLVARQAPGTDQRNQKTRVQLPPQMLGTARSGPRGASAPPCRPCLGWASGRAKCGSCCSAGTAGRCRPAYPRPSWWPTCSRRRTGAGLWGPELLSTWGLSCPCPEERPRWKEPGSQVALVEKRVEPRPSGCWWPQSPQERGMQRNSCSACGRSGPAACAWTAPWPLFSCPVATWPVPSAHPACSCAPSAGPPLAAACAPSCPRPGAVSTAPGGHPTRSACPLAHSAARWGWLSWCPALTSPARKRELWTAWWRGWEPTCGSFGRVEIKCGFSLDSALQPLFQNLQPLPTTLPQTVCPIPGYLPLPFAPHFPWFFSLALGHS